LGNRHLVCRFAIIVLAGVNQAKQYFGFERKPKVDFPLIGKRLRKGKDTFFLLYSTDLKIFCMKCISYFTRNETYQKFTSCFRDG
jgi:hypothetical protein